VKLRIRRSKHLLTFKGPDGSTSVTSPALRRAGRPTNIDMPPPNRLPSLQEVLAQSKTASPASPNTQQGRGRSSTHVRAPINQQPQLQNATRLPQSPAGSSMPTYGYQPQHTHHPIQSQRFTPQPAQMQTPPPQTPIGPSMLAASLTPRLLHQLNMQQQAANMNYQPQRFQGYQEPATFAGPGFAGPPPIPPGKGFNPVPPIPWYALTNNQASPQMSPTPTSDDVQQEVQEGTGDQYGHQRYQGQFPPNPYL
jgi:hypothetical protein